MGYNTALITPVISVQKWSNKKLHIELQNAKNPRYAQLVKEWERRNHKKYNSRRPDENTDTSGADDTKQNQATDDTKQNQATDDTTTVIPTTPDDDADPAINAQYSTVPLKRLNFPRDAVLFANLSEIAYHKNPVQRAQYWGVKYLEFLKTYSTNTVHFWIKPGTKSVVIAIRGTDSIDDVMTDLSLILGTEKLTPRYLTLVLNTQRMIAKVRPTKIYICGHSLGGSLALQLNSKLRRYKPVTYTFNAGITPQLLYKLNGVNDYYIKGDPVSLLGQAKRKRVLKPNKLYNAHSIIQFTQKL